MKPSIPTLVLCALLAGPVAAQDPADGQHDMAEGADLLERGARLFLRGLMDQLEPTLKDLSDSVEPALRQLLELVEDFDAYHPPERLPNGDIIIRRKTPLDPPATDEIEI
ncbi:hypothetical protein [Actibacterium ureilyticum]|uniref:hypothetical protein n=1 Tax=Actibacterium ureilyticum TaxID=1590614 RepID=UPI000BAAB92E|nr:hypothetical protein [Actibacterium ureilyticum]